MTTFLVLAILTAAVVADGTRDKRILLHSDTDIVQAIQALKADNALLHNKLANLDSKCQNSIAELQHVQRQNAQLQNKLDDMESESTANDTLLQNNIAQLQSQNTQLQIKVFHMETTYRGSGSTYVRWGRTTCPGNGTTLAYAGYMGGGHRNHAGAAANYVCLTAHPTWDHYDVSIASDGKVYGVEYQFYHQRADGAAEFFGANIYNQNAPCSVCHSSRSATMMVPGTKLCSPGWTKEYSGYLVTSYYFANASSEYICLDRRPEVVVGGARNDDENVLHFVEGVCGGSLECPPYINVRELTCVVCTK